jgi:hypothetical protein
MVGREPKLQQPWLHPLPAVVRMSVKRCSLEVLNIKRDRARYVSLDDVIGFSLLRVLTVD